MTVVSMNYLLEAGVHFGHQTKRWNPKMKEYIFTSRDDIYIIDLQKTAKKIEEAYAALNKIAADGGKVLFVGTKKQAIEATKEEAMRSNSFYVKQLEKELKESMKSKKWKKMVHLIYYLKKKLLD